MVALRLLSRVRGTLPQGRSLPDEVWRSRHRAILLILWLHVPALAVLAVRTSITRSLLQLPYANVPGRTRRTGAEPAIGTDGEISTTFPAASRRSGT